MIVIKLGGGPVKDARAIRHIPVLIKEQYPEENIVIVCSAIGKTTNAFEALVKASLSENETNTRTESRRILDEIKGFHLGLVETLFSPGVGCDIMKVLIMDTFNTISDTLYYVDRHNKALLFMYDQIVPYGEVLATLIISEYLNYAGTHNKLINAPNFLYTDDTFGSAVVNKEKTSTNLREKMIAMNLAKEKILITQGFIGRFSTVSKDGFLSIQCMTTLGREGSDYTAGLIGNILDATKVVLYKDVPGVMTQNPNHPEAIKVAKKIDVLSYDEYEGLMKKDRVTGLVHPKTLYEVKEKKIPLQVRSFWDLDNEGTMIS